MNVWRWTELCLYFANPLTQGAASIYLTREKTQVCLISLLLTNIIKLKHLHCLLSSLIKILDSRDLGVLH